MSDLRKLLNELTEDSRIGQISGTQEKELNTGLRQIHHKYPAGRYINSKTQASNINYGGCGMFAKLLYYNMRKYLKITPEIVFLANGPVDDINDYKNLLDLYNELELHCVHVTLKIGKYYIDSSGIHAWKWIENQYSSWNPMEAKGMTINTLNRFVDHNIGWNNSFDRYTTGDINKDMVAIMKKLIALNKD